MLRELKGLSLHLDDKAAGHLEVREEGHSRLRNKLTKSQGQREGKLVCLVWGEVGKWRAGLNPHANFEGLSM